MHGRPKCEMIFARAPYAPGVARIGRAVQASAANTDFRRLKRASFRMISKTSFCLFLCPATLCVIRNVYCEVTPNFGDFRWRKARLDTAAIKVNGNCQTKARVRRLSSCPRAESRLTQTPRDTASEELTHKQSRHLSGSRYMRDVLYERLQEH
jgi:hypothetical protein